MIQNARNSVEDIFRLSLHDRANHACTLERSHDGIVRTPISTYFIITIFYPDLSDADQLNRTTYT